MRVVVCQIVPVLSESEREGVYPVTHE
ncbi:MAG: hypothetical protein K0S58_2823, partial [Nitrospira sp.]|nr:hypothetical protein [Nitrospira sp.]